MTEQCLQEQERLSRTYRGRRADTTTEVLAMLLGSSGVHIDLHVEWLTLRVFARRCPRPDPRLWLGPALDPWSSVLHALANTELLGVTGVTVLEQTGPGEKFLEHVRAQLANGPVLLGPMRPSGIWERPRARYFRGDGHMCL